MFCKKCGTKLKEGAAFCVKCGAPASENVTGRQEPSQAYPQAEASPSGYSQPLSPAQQQPAQNQYFSPAPPQTYQQATHFASGEPQGMNWYKFIIWAQLFLWALGSLIVGIEYISGMIYVAEGVPSDLFYSFYPAMKPVDVVFGIMHIALAGFAVYVRFQLSGFKKRGPMLYFVCLGIFLFLAIAYAVASCVACGVGNIGYEVAYTLGYNAITIVLICVNVSYFGKRKHLFVN